MKETDWQWLSHLPRTNVIKLFTVAPALPANISLGWKGLPGANALAYYENSSLTGVKSFITLAIGLSIDTRCINLLGVFIFSPQTSK
jgi:hypothetical protein